jgi:hypothetical protein
LRLPGAAQKHPEQLQPAVQNGIFVEFTDPEMRDTLYQHQLLANPLQIKAARLHALDTRLLSETNDLRFTNEADVHLLLSCLQPAAHSQQLLQILQASQEPEPKANVGGNLTVAVVKTPDGRQSFRVSIDEGKRKHVLERVEQVRQSAHWALRDRIKAPSHEREGR